MDGKSLSEQPMTLTNETWIDEATGLECQRRHCRNSHYCGYVRVPPGSSLEGKKYNDEIPYLAEALERRKEQSVEWRDLGLGQMLACLSGDVKPTLEMLIDVHGGVTFADKITDCEGWWIGFDCAHSGDRSNDNRFGELEYGRWRDEDYIRAECTSMARQLAALSPAQENPR